jgi:glycosyltransferase involved in cell wall biosynthesis
VSGPSRKYRLLFCLPTTQLSGGVKVIFEVANRLARLGHVVELFSYAGAPRWTSLEAPIIPEKDLADIDMSRYDYVLVSNAFFLPLVLPLAASARVIFFSQDWESFHHSTGGVRYEDFVAESETFVALYQLPVPIIAISRAVQSLVRERAGRDAYHMPVGLNKSVFAPQPRKPATPHKRVLMVGNYLMPYKGMRDGFEALRLVSRDTPVQLVMVTQEKRSRSIFDAYDYPIEFRFCPTEDQMPSIYASCDAYMCTSWYEGLGLPALEAFRCGVPVVSTRTYGVSDYGVDDENLLLARPNDSVDLAEKLTRLLNDNQLADRLRARAFATVATDYDWDISVERFLHAMAAIDATYTGAGDVDEAAMRALSKALEDEGNFTPIETYRRFDALGAELAAVSETIVAAGAASPDAVARLRGVRDALKPYVANTRTEYYGAFKGLFDRAQLIVSLSDSEGFVHYLRTILHRGRPSAPADASSLAPAGHRDA